MLELDISCGLLSLPIGRRVSQCVHEAWCCTWVRMHTAFPPPRSEDCMSSHLDLFQAPGEESN